MLNASDDCPYAPGYSTVDRLGCPDYDGDGTSDINDGWTSINPGFAIEHSLTSSVDFWDVDHSPDGKFVLSGDDSGYEGSKCHNWGLDCFNSSLWRPHYASGMVK